MKQRIPLDIERFSWIKHKDFENDNPPRRVNQVRWVNQVRSIELNRDRSTQAEVSAMLYIEHNVRIEKVPSLRNSTFDPEFETLQKVNSNKIFYLDFEKQLDAQGNLHNDKGSAFKSGKVELYYLHGVQIPDKDLVLRRAEDLDAQTILAIQNVDVRRELIRKKGIEQLLDSLFHRVLDKQGNYTLYSVILGQTLNSACNFLKMLNPSIGVWHMEGVPNNIRTVEDALRWRNDNWFVHAEDIT